MMYILLVDGVVLCRIFPYHLRNVFYRGNKKIFIYLLNEQM